MHCLQATGLVVLHRGYQKIGQFKSQQFIEITFYTDDFENLITAMHAYAAMAAYSPQISSFKYLVSSRGAYLKTLAHEL